MAFDPTPITKLLDQAAALFHKSERRDDHAAAFDTRIAQAKALLDETTHHINNVLPFESATPTSPEDTIAELRAQLAAATAANAGKEG